jgi:zinc and cadmium transporter
VVWLGGHDELDGALRFGWCDAPRVTLLLIVVLSLLMSALALVGGLTALLSEATFKRLMLPLVALSAGSLLGGALFHMIPTAVERFDDALPAFAWVAVGFTLFLVLEQFLHWHHCHAAKSEHRHPLGYLLLIADGVHNFVGGVTVGASLVIDLRLGLVAWLVEAAHEVPQELGDFGVLVHSGFSVKRALTLNVLSGLTFLAGGLIAYAARAAIDLAAVVAFAGGNFLYVAAVDLVPEVNRHERLSRSLEHFACFIVGLGVLAGLALLREH